MSQNRVRNCGNQPTTVIRKIRRCSATCSTHSEKKCHCKHTQEKAEKAPDRIQQRHRARKLIRHFQQCAPGLLPPLRSLDFCCPFFVCLHHWSWSFNPLLRFLDISSFRQLPAAALLTKQTRKSCIVHVSSSSFFSVPRCQACHSVSCTRAQTIKSLPRLMHAGHQQRGTLMLCTDHARNHSTSPSVPTALLLDTVLVNASKDSSVCKRGCLF